MTDHNNINNDEALATLYQKRKAAYELPASVKESVLNKVNMTKPKYGPWWRINLRAYTQISAVIGTIAIAFVVISMQVVGNKPVSLHTQTDAMNNLQIVEIHELEPFNEIANSQRNVQALYEKSLKQKSFSSPASTQARKIQYERAQHVYLSKQADLAVHQQRYATVLQHEEGLSLLTCNQHLLKLSQEVVDMLMSGKEEMAIDFSEGQMLSLAFDSNGHIISISQEKSKTAC
jgi:hypothetical protein